MIDNHLKSISMQFDELHKKYESIIIIGDFNSEICEDTMNDFYGLYNHKSRHILKFLIILAVLILYLRINLDHFKIHV